MSLRVSSIERPPSCKLARIVLMLSLAAVCSSGCELMHKYKHEEEKPPGPPVGQVHQVVATWNNKVVVTQDAVNGGANLPGIAGRIYLFGPEIGHPLRGDGSISIGLYDASEQGESRLVEVWNIDKDTMARLFNKDDRIGWGYTIFLPWKNYHPNIEVIEMIARYNPEKGFPMYAPKTKITLNRTGKTIPVSHRVTAKDLAQSQQTENKHRNQHAPIPNTPRPSYQKFRIPMPDGNSYLKNKLNSPQQYPTAPVGPQSVAPQSSGIEHAVHSTVNRPTARHYQRYNAAPPAPSRRSPVNMGERQVAPTSQTSGPSANQHHLSPPVTGGIRATPVTGTSTRVVVKGSPKQVRKTLYGKFPQQINESEMETQSINATSPNRSGVSQSPRQNHNRIRVYPRPVKSSIQPAHQPANSSSVLGTPTEAQPQAESGLFDPRSGNAVYPASD